MMPIYPLWLDMVLKYCVRNLLDLALLTNPSIPMTPYEHWSLVWASVSALSTAVTVIVVISAAIFTYNQVREASRARRLEGALAILTHISSPDLRNARRLIYKEHEKIREKVKSNPTWEELDAFFKEVSGGTVDMSCFHSYLASLENVSILVMHDLAPDDIIEIYFGRIAPHHWSALSEFIAFMRKYYGSTDYLQHFEMMTALLVANGINSSRKKRRLVVQRLKQHKQESQV